MAQVAQKDQNLIFLIPLIHYAGGSGLAPR
jgi:hypothetical protein